MGYLHIENLYRPEAQTILLFRECWALEKIHGTSAHLTFKYNFGKIDVDETYNNPIGWEIKFFSGGESHAKFLSLFDQEKLLIAVKELGVPIDKEITVYGEAYGGSQQGMSHTYGKELKFIVFDVQVGDTWLSVPDADDVAKKLGLEFVHYTKVSLTDLSEIDKERDTPSVQAVRNGVSKVVAEEGFNDSMAEGKPFASYPSFGGILVNPRPREGVVLRPLQEFTMNNGNRVICKHKGDSFKETATPRPVVDPTKMKVLEEATAIANEWTTATRLEHVLDKLPKPWDMSLIPKLIPAMVSDIFREGSGEFIESESVKKAIGKKTVELFRGYLNSKITQ